MQPFRESVYVLAHDILTISLEDGGDLRPGRVALQGKSYSCRAVDHSIAYGLFHRVNSPVADAASVGVAGQVRFPGRRWV